MHFDSWDDYRHWLFLNEDTIAGDFMVSVVIDWHRFYYRYEAGCLVHLSLRNVYDWSH